ncbi:CLUMA_CG017340, isoform A [Clunio marinus]|uniref:Acyl-CoA-binding domain-containing protein 6 n=1 Tax=Clunio marinus TaxID=568069 RepID=A0A1J1IVK0_9DIPT|nr:CLUMA_CG017340, isoform A [Clunio marinus]
MVRSLHKLFVSNLPWTANVSFDRKTGISQRETTFTSRNQNQMSNKVEDKFNLAANYIQSHHNNFNKNDLLQFYAFYKQSTVGELDINQQPRPSFFKLQERAKYDAWSNLGSMDKEKAMESYIDLLTKLVPTWIESEQKENRNSAGTFGVSISRPKFEDKIDEEIKSIKDFIRDGNVEKLKTLLKDVNQSELNAIDENGLGLIHWASDIGNEEILSIILNTKGIDVNLKDGEGQTALFYASSCGHKNCVQLLLKHEADKSIVDNEESSCLDVAYDDEIRMILK